MTEIEKVTNCEYLGQTVVINSTKQEVSIRIKAGWSVFGKYREIFPDRQLPMSLKRKVFNHMDAKHGLSLVKKLETSQQVMERRMLHVKLKDRIHSTTIRQRTRVTDIDQIRNQYKTEMGWTHNLNER